MNDQFQEQTSLFVDDELSADECEFFVRRLQRDPDARGRLLRYQLIGAALRGELKTPDPELLRRRLQGAMDGVGHVKGVRARERARYARFFKPAIGLAIAASVTVAALLVLQTSSLDEAPDASVSGLAALAATGDGRADDGASYVVPPDTDAPRLAYPTVRLTNYMMQHGEYASRLSRTSVHSNVVTTGQPAVPGDDGSAEQ
ncbi:MAG TPA: sigma-E factor negative regulatory protein [Gammaproteobacteria bacterium]|jgi:negative regulator of sigma E activity